MSGISAKEGRHPRSLLAVRWFPMRSALWLECTETFKLFRFLLAARDEAVEIDYLKTNSNGI